MWTLLFIIVLILYFSFKHGKTVANIDDDFWSSLDINSSNTEEAQEITIKENSFDISKIKEYQGESFKKFEFRPQVFSQFIGQEEAKNKAQTIIKRIKSGMKGHFFVNGIKGHGKSTYVKLIAKELDAYLIERIGKQIDEKNLIDIVNEINTSTKDNVMFFLDEIDSTDPKVIKVLNPIIESFEIAGKRIKPFIFACATINKHILIKNNPDTLDRIGTHIKFSRYNSDEIVKIITQYKEQLYSSKQISKKVYNIISINCKYNPRTAISLLEDYVVEGDIDYVLKNSKIIKDGLTETDIKILNALKNSGKRTGANALAQRAGLSEKEYTTEYEPFLCEYEYIERTPTRCITEKGRKILETIQ